MLINTTNNLQTQHTKKPFLHLLLLAPLLFLCAKADIFIYAGCSQDKYTPTSSFESNLNSFLTSSVNSSPQSLYNNYSLVDTSTNSPLYGLYQCRGDLTPSECSSCIQSTVTQIGLVCPYSYGATLQLEGCYLRHERYDFLGKLDTTVMYRKCSKSISVDVEFLRRREYVLEDLQQGVGFRVSSSGSVQGFSQCLGDLSQSDCSACLAEAVKDLKTICGSAAAAHVFLAKCYAQYWEAGYYDLGTHASGGAQEDEVAKTIAIIVGIIGALAILIVLLSLCRSSTTGK